MPTGDPESFGTGKGYYRFVSDYDLRDLLEASKKIKARDYITWEEKFEQLQMLLAITNVEVNEATNKRGEPCW